MLKHFNGISEQRAEELDNMFIEDSYEGEKLTQEECIYLETLQSLMP